MACSIFPRSSAPPLPPLPSLPIAVRRVSHIARPQSRAAPRLVRLRPLATPEAEFLVNQSAIIGQGIVYFTLFYTTANWWYYRRTREDAEDAEKNRKNK